MIGTLRRHWRVSVALGCAALLAAETLLTMTRQGQDPAFADFRAFAIGSVLLEATTAFVVVYVGLSLIALTLAWIQRQRRPLLAGSVYAEPSAAPSTWRTGLAGLMLWTSGLPFVMFIGSPSVWVSSGGGQAALPWPIWPLFLVPFAFASLACGVLAFMRRGYSVVVAVAVAGMGYGVVLSLAGNAVNGVTEVLTFAFVLYLIEPVKPWFRPLGWLRPRAPSPSV